MTKTVLLDETDARSRRGSMPERYYLRLAPGEPSRTATPLDLLAETGYVSEPGAVPGELTQRDLDRGYAARGARRRFRRQAQRLRAQRVLRASGTPTMGNKSLRWQGAHRDMTIDLETGERRRATATRPSDRRAKNRARNRLARRARRQ